MTRDETKQILMRIQTSFPNWKPNAPLSIVTDTWNEMLSDYAYEQVLAAVKSYILSDSSGFAPGIGEVVNIIHLLFEEKELEDSEAWQLVRRAIYSSGDYDRAQKNFENLPSAAQRAVGSAGQLREWALTENLNFEVIASNFKKTYHTVRQRENELKKLSPDLLKLINRVDVQHQIDKKDKQYQLTISEERELAKNRSVPMPERAKEKLRHILR